MVILASDQLDAQILCFIISLLQSSHVSINAVLIIRRSNCINTASGIVTLPIFQISNDHGLSITTALHDVWTLN
jgi:hypothetical protein